jgi:dephospho-CoA kinase
VAAHLLRAALTGGIATGKSYCLKRFAALGIPVIDADELAHETLEPGTTASAAVVRRFGDEIVGKDGRIDRPALARIVFADAAARRDLEAVVHPAVYGAIQTWFQELAASHTGGLVALADIPLLFETEHQADFDSVIVVACEPDTQIARLLRRDITREEALQRIASQLPIADKIGRADYVIRTDGEHTDTDRQVVEIFERLRAEASSGSK